MSYGTVACSECGSPVTHVIKTDSNIRTRECTRCGTKFRTFEITEEDHRWLTRAKAALRREFGLPEVRDAPPIS